MSRPECCHSTLQIFSIFSAARHCECSTKFKTILRTRKSFEAVIQAKTKFILFYFVVCALCSRSRASLCRAHTRHTILVKVYYVLHAFTKRRKFNLTDEIQVCVFHELFCFCFCWCAVRCPAASVYRPVHSWSGTPIAKEAKIHAFSRAFAVCYSRMDHLRDFVHAMRLHAAHVPTHFSRHGFAFGSRRVPAYRSVLSAIFICSQLHRLRYYFYFSAHLAAERF